MHPELKVPEKAQEFISYIQTKNARLWKEAQNPNRDVLDTWDAKIRLQEDSGELQDEMDSLGERYAELNSASLLNKYGFIPAHPTALSHLTANFLHGGWLHLIGNMWFLWLAGAVLEDTWGRMIYPAFYLVAGVLAFQVHAMFSAGSFTPTIGASGAIAGLMGAFLVRFPTTKIEMGWLLFYRIYRFKMAAYWLLPVWLLTEILYGSAFGQSSPASRTGRTSADSRLERSIAVRHSEIGPRANGRRRDSGKDRLGQPSAPRRSQRANGKGPTGPSRRGLAKNGGREAGFDRWVPHAAAHLLAEERPSRASGRPGKLLALEIKANDQEGALHTCQELRNSGGENYPRRFGWTSAGSSKRRRTSSHAAEEYLELAQTYPTKNRACSRKWPRDAST